MKLREKLKTLVVFSLVVLVLGLVSVSHVSAAETDEDYQSYYEMTGGLFTRASNVSKGKDICISIAPISGSNGCSMGIWLQKYNSDTQKWEFVRKEKYVDSVYGGTVKYKDLGKGKYRIYLRNYSNMSSGGTGRLWTGGILVEFK